VNLGEPEEDGWCLTHIILNNAPVLLDHVIRNLLFQFGLCLGFSPFPLRLRSRLS
jgi:hypothetical protein